MPTPETNQSSCGCSDSPCSEPTRRDFLQTTGITLGTLAVPHLTKTVIAGPFTQPTDDISHFVPVDKKLTAAWIASLTRRGEPRVYRGDDLRYLAMPVGGVAAGQLYLRGDGTLSCWQLFNQQYFSGYGRDNYDLPPSEAPVEQGFVLVIDKDNMRSIRRMAQFGFKDIAFTGRYPIGAIEYSDPHCPVSATMEAFSPFIPLNAADSSLPATIFDITVRNTSDKVIGVAMLAWLENAVCFHNAPYLRAQRVSNIETRNGRSRVVHSVRALPKSDEPVRQPIILADFEGADYGHWNVEGEAFGAGPAHGTLTNQNPVSGFQGKGLVNTFLGGDAPTGRLTSPAFEINRHFINFMIGGGNHKNETCINLLIDGKVVRTSTGKNQELLRWDSWDVRDLAGSKATLEIVDTNSAGWGHINIDQVELSDESRFGPSGPLEELDDFGTMTIALDGETAPSIDALNSVMFNTGAKTQVEVEPATHPMDQRYSSAIQSTTTSLQPGEQHTFTFVLAWHFPNRANVGQQYANRFADASAVASYVLDNHKRLTHDTRQWVKTFYDDSTLPHWLLERLHIPVCNLATGTCQWWKSGRFWAWEGVGCCSGTCTHVWNYAHAMARLFPELERSAREMQDLDAALHDDGLVGFRGERNHAYAADGQAGTVLKCYREHLVSADDAFLKRNWPNIRKVLLYLVQQDANDDGVIENSQPNTYDIDFFGPNTFVGSLYLAALRAGEEMARLVGDEAFADRVKKIFRLGRDYSVKQLYNGEYFIQDVDLKAHPQFQYGQGCLSDQLFGQGWAYQLGLGAIYPAENILATLQSIWKYNWAPDIKNQNDKHKPERWFVHAGDAGLFTCTWPKSTFLTDGVRYRNEVWTGIEYQVAGHMIFDGMVTEGLAICRAIHDRYDPSKRNPFNEVECGDHYARAMASWGVYTALCGFEYDGPRGHIGFAPRVSPENFSAAFTAAEGWGTFSQSVDAQRHQSAIELRWGALRLVSIALYMPDERRVGHGRVTVTVDDRKIEATAYYDDRRIEVILEQPITIRTGQRLQIVAVRLKR